MIPFKPNQIQCWNNKQEYCIFHACEIWLLANAFMSFRMAKPCLALLTFLAFFQIFSSNSIVIYAMASPNIGLSPSLTFIC